MRNFIFYLLLLLLLSIVSCKTTSQKKDPNSNNLKYVDQYIGSDFHGHVFVGANIPFGLVQLGPNNPTQGWDWCSGYHYSDSLLIGFAHTHLSGTGIGDLGDILFMPVSEDYDFTIDQDSSYNWKSKYTHNDELIEPGYYKIDINRWNISAELTTSKRVGYHNYKSNDNKNINLVIDLEYGTGWDQLTEAFIDKVDDYSIHGYRFSKGWANNQQVFFHTKFSKKIKDITIINKDNHGIKTVLIKFEKGSSLFARTALSPTGIEGAKNNFDAENYNFDEAKRSAQNSWQDELSKIHVTTNNESLKSTFYTAMYHAMIFPSLFSDVDGAYRGADLKVKKNQNHETYTVFSLWDTYRAAHPLYTIIQPEKVNDFVQSMLNIYKEQGKLPIWHLYANETNTMVGYHAVPVIVDAYLKGFRDYDVELAFEAVKNSALLDENGQNYVKSLGYIPADTQNESVAKGLEYAIDDWAIAQMAKELGHEEDYKLFLDRSKNYKKYFDQSTQFMRGRIDDHQYRTPFDPFYSLHRSDDFCEGNAWQYTWLVPHDVEGLIDLFGSEERFSDKLDSLFSVESKKNDGASSDITGLIGQYAHGNEPSHHITYLYAYVGEQWKTAKLIQEVNKMMYYDAPDGLRGNEDCGQMSAWHIFSTLGFYPVNPMNSAYVFGSPMFDAAKIQLGYGKYFTIKTINNSEKNMYIQSVELNGSSYTKSYITHKDIMDGGEIIFTMGAKPNKEFGKKIEDRPQSILY